MNKELIIFLKRFKNNIILIIIYVIFNRISTFFFSYIMSQELYSTASSDDEIPEYFKERRYVDLEKIKYSTCLYVGNLSYFTTEIQLYELFSRCGKLERIIMGLNKQTKSPCGFCFVEYLDRESARIAILSLNNTYLDNRLIRVDWDVGLEEGRQYGRGITGCQRRDEIRKKFDPDRPTNIALLGGKRERVND